MAGSSRQFGIVTDTQGLKQGCIVNSITHNFNSETAEARDEKGKLIDLAAYGETEEITVDGLTTGTGVKNGDVIWLSETIDGTTNTKGYLVTSTSKTESNTAFVTQNVTARYAPSCEFWWTDENGVICSPLSTINSDVPSSDPDYVAPSGANTP